MVNVRVSANVQRDFDRRLSNLGIEIIRDLQKNFNSLRDEVGKGIDEAVDGFADLLGAGMSNQQAAELGIGDDGSIDTNKINNAWKQLLSKPPGLSAAERPTAFSVTKLRSKSGIGTIRITMDSNKLYRLPLSIVETDSDINEGDGFDDNVIPWLKWFIEGKAISGYQFTSNPKKRVNLDVSRTGRGIMILGGFWDFPQGQDPFPLIERAIEELAVRAVERYIERNT